MHGKHQIKTEWCDFFKSQIHYLDIYSNKKDNSTLTETLGAIKSMPLPKMLMKPGSS